MRPDALEFPHNEGSHWMGKRVPNQHEYVARMYSRTNSENRLNRISGYRDGCPRDQDDLQIDGTVITPRNGTATLRVGSRDFRSWFHGAAGKVAVYNRELPGMRIAAHTNAMTTSNRTTSGD